MKTRNYIIAFLFIVTGIANAQQEIQYSQNILNSHLLINPAYSGIWEESTIGLKYRNQWVGAEGAPTSFLLLGETALKDNLNLGVVVSHDEIGINSISSFELDPSMQIKVNETAKLSFGSKIGMVYQSSDFSKLNGVNLTDPLYSDNTTFAPYIGLGMLYYTPKYYIGLSSPRVVNFEKTNTTQKLLASHIYLYGGTKFELEKDLDLRPQLLFKNDFKTNLIAEISTQLWFKNKVAVGVSYRTNDAFSAMFQTNIKNFVLGYSYDITTSPLKDSSNGSHELYLGIKLFKAPKKEEDTEEQPKQRKTHQRYF